MKLNTFNRGNTASMAPKGEPRIHLNEKGLITINHSLTDLLELKNEDGVELHQDKDNPVDWFISKSETEDAFKIRRKTDDKHHCFNSVALVKTIFTACDIDFSSVSFKVAKEPETLKGVKYYAIFTSSAAETTRGSRK